MIEKVRRGFREFSKEEDKWLVNMSKTNGLSFFNNSN